MITFKESGEEASGSFQAHVNRKAIGFWLEAESAAEAEQKLINWALKGFLVQERDDKINELGQEVQALIEQRSELELTIAKMKTDAPEPEKFKSRRLFRRS